jgi:glucose-6-phosphate isomerase
MKLSFGSKDFYPSIRRLSDMRDVLYDKSLKGEQELYYMYRGLSLSKRDESIMREHGIRYDITVIPPGSIGKEWVKTVGHYHPFPRGKNLSYPELYEVLEGEAYYLFQLPLLEDGKIRYERIKDVVVVRAAKGDKVIVPPNYGHITINPSKKILKMANFIARDFSSIYEPFRRMGGGAYFALSSGKWVRNKNYKEISGIRWLPPPKVGKRGEEIYKLLRKEPQKLDFLVNPEKTEKILGEWLS